MEEINAKPRSIISELRDSNVPAEVILDRERKIQIEAKLAEKEELERKKRERSGKSFISMDTNTPLFFYLSSSPARSCVIWTVACVRQGLHSYDAFYSVQWPGYAHIRGIDCNGLPQSRSQTGSRSIGSRFSSRTCVLSGTFWVSLGVVSNIRYYPFMFSCWINLLEN
jgi:hypothetical protein